MNMQPILQRGAVVPNFTLPDTSGQAVRRSQYRSRKHLALVFLADAEDLAAQTYLRALADVYAAIQAASGEVLVIVRGEAAARLAKAKLALPFPVLIDGDDRVTARFLPAETRVGVAVTDRYGELYFSVAAVEMPGLPPVGELRDWVEAIDRQCAI